MSTTQSGGTISTTAGGGGPASTVRLEDGITTNLATVAQFHNADNQSPGGTAYGLLTGGVAQLLNILGNLDRQRETGIDGISAVGVSTGSAQFAMAFLTTDSTDNFAAGTRTFTPVAMSGTLNGVPWSIQVGTVLSLDSGANQENVIVTAVTGTTFTCVTTKSHNGTVTPFNVAGFVYNQERDAAGELDGATGSGTAIAAEYEYNSGGGGPASAPQQTNNYDRAKNFQGKGLGTGSLSAQANAAATSITASAAPTGLSPGAALILYDTNSIANSEQAYVAKNYTPGSTIIPLQQALVNTHTVANTTLRWDIFNPIGGATSGCTPLGVGVEEDLVLDLNTNLLAPEAAATKDAVPAINVPIENEGLYNGATLDRGRSVQGATGGTGLGVEAASLIPTSSANQGIVPVVSSALEASHVLKASAGNLYKLNVLNYDTSGRMVLIFNAAAVPGAGAVSPVDAFVVPAGSASQPGEVAIDYGDFPLQCGTGISVALSTNMTTPFTLALGTSAYFSGKVV